MGLRGALLLVMGVAVFMPQAGPSAAAQGAPHMVTPAAQPLSQSPLELVRKMAQNEANARRNRVCFLYTSFERSTRTGGRLWQEKVVDMPDGLMRRLVAEDGKPLSPERAMAEDRRIAYLAASPEAFRAANADRKADELRLVRLLEILPRAFLFTYAGEQDGAIRIAYRPNPDYVPASYEERVVHQMAGTLEIQSDSTRLRSIDGHLIDRVSFGYGLLGHMEKGSGFSMTRIAVTQDDWKTSKISVHMDGKILLLKSISREQESSHTEIRALPANESLAQAADITRP